MSGDLRRRLEAIRANRDDGADALGIEAARLLADAARRLDRGGLEEFAVEVRTVRPAMAPPANAAHVVLEALGRGDDPEGAARSCAAAMERAGPEAARRAAELLRGAPAVLVHSWSATAVGALEQVREPSRPPVAVCESRPALEGRRTAHALVEAGYAVTFLTEAAAGSLLGEGATLLAGADALYRDGSVANKVGTRLLALAAREQAGRVVVAASSWKRRFGPGWERPGLDPDACDPDEADPEQVWGDPPPGVVVRNPTFERIAGDLVDRIVTERGDHQPGGLAEDLAG